MKNVNNVAQVSSRNVIMHGEAERKEKIGKSYRKNLGKSSSNTAVCHIDVYGAYILSVCSSKI